MKRLLKTSDGVVVIVTFLAPLEYERARDAEYKLSVHPPQHSNTRPISSETTGGRTEQWNMDAQ